MSQILYLVTVILMLAWGVGWLKKFTRMLMEKQLILSGITMFAISIYASFIGIVFMMSLFDKIWN